MSWLYALGIWIRNLCYDFGIFAVTDVHVPVISVGNVTTGGTGKTPLVEYLVRHLLRMGKRIAVISRGYGRSTSGTVIVSDGKTLLGNVSTAGDEPWQIAKKFPEIIVIVDEKRVRAAQLAAKRYTVDVIVLDDGFQHRSLKRDMDIVVIDSTTDLHSVNMLPAGHRREPLSSLTRATSIAFSRCEQPEYDHDEYSEYTTASSCCMKHIPQHLVSQKNEIMSLKDCSGKSCVAFAGIGNPKSFEAMLKQIGLSVTEFIVFPDHHVYSDADVESLRQKAEHKNSDLFVTTEKDAMRLLANSPNVINGLDHLFYLRIEQNIIRGESRLQQMVEDILGKNAV